MFSALDPTIPTMQEQNPNSDGTTFKRACVDVLHKKYLNILWPDMG